MNETNLAAKQAQPAPAENAPVAPPCAMVIFGAAGDLTKRLVVPALYTWRSPSGWPTDSNSSASISRPRAPRIGARA